MADNTMTDIATIPTPPALSESNWPGDKPAPAATTETKSSETPELKTDAETPPAEEKPATTETPSAEGTEGEARETSETEAPTAPQIARRPPGGVGKRIAELTHGQQAAEARADKLADLVEKLVERIPGAQAPAAPGTSAPTAAPDPRPKRETFDDPDAYDEALVQWSGRQQARVIESALEARRAQEQAAETERRQRESADARAKADHDNFQAQRKQLESDPTYADFEEVAFNPDVEIPRPAVPMIMRAGPKVLYYLAHPDHTADRERINAMLNPQSPTFDPLSASFEIGAIRNRIETAARPQRSSAPPPIRPINGGTNRATERTLNDIGNEGSVEEYAAKRLPVLQAERRNRMFGNRTN